MTNIRINSTQLFTRIVNGCFVLGADMIWEYTINVTQMDRIIQILDLLTNLQTTGFSKAMKQDLILVENISSKFKS